jgi:ribonucleoside-diphosphate reductase alpha chain
VDYIFRWLGMQFIPGYRELNAPRRAKPAEQAAHAELDGSAGGAPGFHGKHFVKEDTTWQDQPTAGGRLLGAGTLDSAPTGAPSHGAPPQAGAEARTAASPLHGGRALSDIAAASMLAASDGPEAAHPEGGVAARARIVTVSAEVELRATGSVLDQSNAQLMGDAPACDVCGSITVRNGTCYRCLNCGQSMGCS